MTQLLSLLVQLLDVVIHQTIDHLAQRWTNHVCFLQIFLAETTSITLVLILAVVMNVKVEVDRHFLFRH